MERLNNIFSPEDIYGEAFKPYGYKLGTLIDEVQSYKDILDEEKCLLIRKLMEASREDKYYLSPNHYIKKIGDLMYLFNVMDDAGPKVRFVFKGSSKEFISIMYKILQVREYANVNRSKA